MNLITSSTTNEDGTTTLDISVTGQAGMVLVIMVY